MERHRKQATRGAAVGAHAAAAFGAVELAAFPWLTGDRATRVVARVPRVERAFHALEARAPRSAWPGWEARAASAVGAAVARWLATDGDRATTVFRRGGHSHSVGTVVRVEKGSGNGCVDR
jgi:hypothetical protein